MKDSPPIHLPEERAMSPRPRLSAPRIALFCLAMVCQALVASRAASAADGSGRYKAVGAGIYTCGWYTGGLANMNAVQAEVRGRQQSTNFTNDTLKIQGFVEGWLTAYNLIVSDTFSLLPADNAQPALAWLKTYCQKNQAETLSSAMQRFAAEAYPARVRAP